MDLSNDRFISGSIPVQAPTRIDRRRARRARVTTSGHSTPSDRVGSRFGNETGCRLLHSVFPFLSGFRIPDSVDAHHLPVLGQRPQLVVDDQFQLVDIVAYLVQIGLHLFGVTMKRLIEKIVRVGFVIA